MSYTALNYFVTVTPASNPRSETSNTEAEVMRLRNIVLAGAFATGMMVTAVPLPAVAASCPDNNWGIYDGRIGKYFAGSGVHIRTGPSTNCTSKGLGYPSHNVQLDCWKSGDGGTWSHLFNFATGVSGWSKDSLLVGAGANVHC